jgi:hypothetical protein
MPHLLSLKHSLCYCTVLEVMPIRQLGLSPLFSFASGKSSSSSSSSSLSYSLSEVAISLRLLLKTFNITSIAFLSFLTVNPLCSAFLISSCFWIIAVPEALTHIVTTVHSLPAGALIHISLSSSLAMHRSYHFSGWSIFWDCKMCTAPKARIISTSNLLFPPSVW